MVNSDNFHMLEDLKFDPEKLQEALKKVLKIKKYDDAEGISNFGRVFLE